MAQAIQAITFDLWDTILRDDSDEPKRSALGLRPKPLERCHLLWEALERRQPIALERVALACDTADAALYTVWHEQHVTWTVATRMGVVLRALKRTLPDGEMAEVVRAWEEMELEVSPELIAGCAEVLAELAGRYKLGVVSDTINSPGRCLRRLLELHGVKTHFSGFAFSDEVGRSKPHRDMFSAAAAQLGVRVEEMVHIGDREQNDIQGAHTLGMKAVLLTAARDMDEAGTSADAVCRRYQDLPGILDALVGQKAGQAAGQRA